VRRASASCVSPGIARELARSYGLATMPTVVRNIPDHVPLAPRSTGTRITVLYHGLFKPDRGLIRLIESVPDWPEPYHLLLRGRAPRASFLERMRAAAATSGSRIKFEAMVPPESVVAAAHDADIGIFLPDLSSMQNRFALPNKVFEYLSAGLMTIVPAATDIAELLERYGTGITIENSLHAPIGSILATLSARSIDAYRAAAHRAAGFLSFDHEAVALRSVLRIS
jgi:glycogen synthase